MEALHRLVHSMSKSELRMFRTSITSGAFRSEGETKTLRIFEFLLKNKETPSSDDCSRVVYGKPGDPRLKMLKLRFKAKLLDSLLNDSNIERQSAHLDELDYAGIKIRKKFAQFQQLYYLKGNQPIVMQTLNEVIALSRKWEIYTNLAESLKFKKYLKGFSQGEKEFDRINTEISFYEKCNLNLNLTTDLYYKLMMRSSFEGSQESESIRKFYAQSIEGIRKYYAETNSANIKYYLNFFEIGHFQNIKNYSEARAVCNELLEMLNNNKAAYRKLRVGSTLLNLGQCDIWLNNYQDAVKNIRTAQNYFSVFGVNYPVAKEQEFLALFYGNQIKEAGLVVSELLKFTIAAVQGDFRLAKYEFYQANSLFKKGEFKAALKILSRKHELSKDKIGWEIAIRILTIMTLIELDMLDEATAQTEGLRKHMERHSKMKEVRERDRIILKTLQAMEKQGYVQDKIGAEERTLLEKLQSTTAKWRWEPVTPELIPFDRWMAARYKKK